MSTTITESTVEDAALEILDGHGYTVLHGPEIAPAHAATPNCDTLLPRLIPGEIWGKPLARIEE